LLDWIFEGIITWISSTVTSLMDAVSGLFLNALGTDMTAMEEYFPFVSKAFTVMQYSAWALLFLITVWQLFRVFGGPISEAENPWTLLARSAIFALLIGYMWSGGVCLKCGVSQTDSAPDRNREKLKEEIYEEQNH